MLISVKVIPNARRVEVKELSEGNYKVYLTAKAQKGSANKQLLEVLAEFFRTPKSRIKIIKGEKDRNKVVQIEE